MPTRHHSPPPKKKRPTTRGRAIKVKHSVHIVAARYHMRKGDDHG